MVLKPKIKEDYLKAANEINKRTDNLLTYGLEIANLLDEAAEQFDNRRLHFLRINILRYADEKDFFEMEREISKAMSVLQELTSKAKGNR
jgi:hypothetical protein